MNVDLLNGILMGVAGFAALDRLIGGRYRFAAGWAIILGTAILFYMAPP